MTINHDKFWELMIDKKINKIELREKAKITTNVTIKLGKNKSVQIETLAKICEALKCNIKNIVERKNRGKNVEI